MQDFIHNQLSEQGLLVLKSNSSNQTRTIINVFEDEQQTKQRHCIYGGGGASIFVDCRFSPKQLVDWTFLKEKSCRFVDCILSLKPVDCRPTELKLCRFVDSNCALQLQILKILLIILFSTRVYKDSLCTEVRIQ